MNNKRGFTLVELLAVIIILSLLALLTSTAVTKLVKDAKNDLNSTQIELIKSAAQTLGSENLAGLPSPGECSYLTVGNLKDYGLIDSHIKNLNTNQEISNDLKIKIETKINENSGTIITEYEVTENVEGCYKQAYANGEVVYFDVYNGVACTEDDYQVDNSMIGYNGINSTGNQNGCLKFYAFNDNLGRKINLLLDHNTTNSINWTNDSTQTTENGPIDVINKLYEDTKNWKGTLTPINYEYKGNNTQYTINYKSFKARLITAQEIAQITGADKKVDIKDVEEKLWNEQTSQLGYYFETTSSVYSDNCTDNDETTKCKYGWLYDRTGADCKNNGCFNNTNETITGYWTSTANSIDVSVSWMIDKVGRVQSNSSANFSGSGVRPVIEVLKSKLQ